MIMQAVKKRFIVIAVVAGSALAGAFTSCFAGAWTPPEGKLYDKSSLNYYTADANFTDTNIGNYIEYGLTDTVSIINSIYFKRIKNSYNSNGSDVATTTTGIADMEMGLKHKLMEGPYGILSHQGVVKIPGPYDKNGALPLGNGQFDVEYRVLYGLSLWRLFPGYANFEAGYRYRAEAPSDEFRYLAEIGADITNRLYARVKLDGIQGMHNAGKVTDQSGNPTTMYEFDLLRLDSALGYKLTDTWGVELGYSPVLSAVNTAKGASWSVGATYQLR